jgi:histidine triad (HIT) family protein
MSDTIFDKIIRKEIPAAILYEDEWTLAFKDINPKAPVHFLVIPKIPIPRVSDIKGSEHAELLGKLFDTANKVAAEAGLTKKGFRVVINCGPDGGQDVEYLHLHVLGGGQMAWPPG